MSILKISSLAIKEKYRKLLDDGKLVTAETIRDAYLNNSKRVKRT